nr:hypothetical protein [Tanacetum cinerariifolium]
MLIMQAQENGVVLDKDQLLFIAGGQTNTFDDDDVDEAPVQDLALNEDNVFQADQCDAFDSDVDEDPTAQTMFMENISSAGPIYDEVGLAYDLNILSKVQDHDNYIDSVGVYHEVHEMQIDVQPTYVVNPDAEYMSNNDIILYEQYVKENTLQVVQSDVSSMPNDALVMIINDMPEQPAECVSANEQNKVVNESLTTELANYKEPEELLKKELHSVKMQLNSTINHNKLIKKEVTTLKKDFKQMKKKVAIGYKNPLYLTKSKQVQPALYNGHELVKTTHAPAIVHDLEDTLELAETTRMKMLEKSKSTLWVDSKIKIASSDYSKENYLATFTPQRHLTLKQIFWSEDVYKHLTNVPKPIIALTVYPPNTPDKLVPKVLRTKIQVKINIYTLIQPFSEFNKTYKKRITPTGLTEGERGFEQTKEFYLTEVFLFFKMLKERFKGIQTALVKKVKEMKEIFEQMEYEVEQNVVDKQCAEIERKNLLIENENLIADCLSNELLYSVMNDVHTVFKFSELNDAYTVEQARRLELEAEISKLKHKIQKHDHSEMIKHFSKLEIDYLNLQLKYQNLKERFGNNKSRPTQDTPEFDTVFEINKMKASLQGKDNAIRKLKEQISQMNKRRNKADCILDFKALDFQNTELTKKVNALQEQNEWLRAE